MLYSVEIMHILSINIVKLALYIILQKLRKYIIIGNDEYFTVEWKTF